MSGLLALDLAKKTGWAICPPDYRSPAFSMPDPEYLKLRWGTELVGDPGEPPGSVFLNFHRWLGKAIQHHKPLFVAVEAPFVHPTNFRGMGMPYGFNAIVQMHAHHFNIPFYQVEPSPIKKHWTGHGGSKKPEMLQAALDRGLEIRDHNACDAVALLDYIVADLTRLGKWPPRGVRYGRGQMDIVGA